MRHRSSAAALLFLAWTGSSALADPPDRSKIDPRLRTLGHDDEAEFLVVLAHHADLRGVDALSDREARIAEVVARLEAAAAASQPPVIAELVAAGAEVRPFWVANVLWVRGTGAAADLAARRADVERIDANPRLPRPRVEARPVPLGGPSVEWNVALVGAEAVWAQGYDGTGAVIGSQDTGYFWDHPALRDTYRGWNGSTADHDHNWHDAVHSDEWASPTCPANSTAPCDDGFLFPHGTYTTGVAVGDDGGANRIGVAPGARWIGCRSIDLLGGTPASYIECFQWLVAPTDLAGNDPAPSLAPHVINNSWACIPAEGCNPDTLETIVATVRAAGIVVVAAAGNDGAGCATIQYPPAIYEASFTVGASDAADVIGAISSRGPVTIDGSNRLKPNVVAPGIAVRSAVGIWDIFGKGDVVYDYLAADGTSASAPHVAGAVALLLDARPDLAGSVEVIERLLEASAFPITAAQSCGGIPGSVHPNNIVGHGRLDVAELVLGDADTDGTDNLDDCAPVDASTWQLPGPATALALAGTAPTSLSWSAPAEPGATSLDLELLRSGAAADFAAATCLPLLGPTNAEDATTPAPGAAFFYAVRAVNRCGADAEAPAGAPACL
jgi:subtilisin family serine protease